VVTRGGGGATVGNPGPAIGVIGGPASAVGVIGNAGADARQCPPTKAVEPVACNACRVCPDGSVACSGTAIDADGNLHRFSQGCQGTVPPLPPQQIKVYFRPAPTNAIRQELVFPDNSGRDACDPALPGSGRFVDTITIQVGPTVMTMTNPDCHVLYSGSIEQLKDGTTTFLVTGGV
jgi:hypothetical protein